MNKKTPSPPIRGLRSKMPTFEPSEIQTLTFTNEDGKTFEMEGNFLGNVTIPETTTTTTTTTTTKITSATTTSSGAISVDPDWFIPTTALNPVYPSYTTTFTIPSVANEIDEVKEECKGYMEKVDEHVDKLEEDIEFLNEERLNHKNLIDSLFGTIHDYHTEIDTLKKELEDMKSYTKWLENKIHDLRGPAND